MKIFLVFIMFVSFIFADSEHHYNKDLTYLNLNSIQKSEIVKIIKNYRKSIKLFRKQKETISEKKQKIFVQDNFDEVKVIMENNNLNSKAVQIEISFLKKMHNLLSKKQREKFARYMEDWDLE